VITAQAMRGPKPKKFPMMCSAFGRGVSAGKPLGDRENQIRGLKKTSMGGSKKRGADSLLYQRVENPRGGKSGEHKRSNGWKIRDKKRLYVNGEAEKGRGGKSGCGKKERRTLGIKGIFGRENYRGQANLYEESMKFCRARLKAKKVMGMQY